jgi:uncharacterized protein YjbJ (UPF0337 family)
MSEHKGEEIKGRMKEAVGVATDDKDLQREGKIDPAPRPRRPSTKLRTR